MDLERARVADDEQRVAERLELRLQRVLVEIASFDEEDRAIPVRRQLLMDGVEREVLDVRGRLRERLAAHGRRHSAYELEQSGLARVHDARVAQRLPLLPR